MQGFNNKLEVGMQAMIIATRDPKNSHFIGCMVTIESLHLKGEAMPDSYLTEAYLAVRERGPSIFQHDMAVVSGVHTNVLVKDNIAVLQQRHLMPLPPLDDDVIVEASEKPKEAVN